MTTSPVVQTDMKWPGIVLIVTGMLAALVMMVHPAAEGGTTQARLQSLARISSTSLHVHMAMIAFIIALWLSLAYTARAWWDSGPVWLASRLYAMGAIAMVSAALISGFVLGAYLDRTLPVASVQDVVPSALLLFSANQVLAGFGMILMSLSILLWSGVLMRQGAWLARACGGYGLCLGVVCLALYALGKLALDVHGMMAVVFGQSVWYVLFGAWLIRHGIPTRSR